MTNLDPRFSLGKDEPVRIGEIWQFTEDFRDYGIYPDHREWETLSRRPFFAGSDLLERKFQYPVTGIFWNRIFSSGIGVVLGSFKDICCATDSLADRGFYLVLHEEKVLLLAIENARRFWLPQNDRA